MKNKQYRTVLTIAGSDSIGGAGIQADLKTFSALGCYGMSVITAVTAQNTATVNGIHPIPPEFIEQQLQTVITDIRPDAIKIGMLFSEEIVCAVANQLRKHPLQNIVLDPVMISQSNCHLIEDSAAEAIVRELFPLADVITPNTLEATHLTGCAINSYEDMIKPAKILAKTGCKSVLIKGGHLEKETMCSDFLYFPDNHEPVSYGGLRISTNNDHGTGCTLSSAIAAFMAQGKDIRESVAKAKEYIHEAIDKGSEYIIGKGSGPVHHFCRFWQ